MIKCPVHDDTKCYCDARPNFFNEEKKEHTMRKYKRGQGPLDGAKICEYCGEIEMWYDLHEMKDPRYSTDDSKSILQTKYHCNNCKKVTWQIKTKRELNFEKTDYGYKVIYELIEKS